MAGCDVLVYCIGAWFITDVLIGLGTMGEIGGVSIWFPAETVYKVKQVEKKYIKLTTFPFCNWIILIHLLCDMDTVVLPSEKKQKPQCVEYSLKSVFKISDELYGAVGKFVG